MKARLLLLLLVVCLLTFPWRLLVLLGETFVVTPGFTRTTRGDTRYWQTLDLQARLAALGWSLHYVTPLQINETVAYGITDRSTHNIYIESTLHWDARYAVMCHEAGHVFQPPWLSEEQGEVFAEGVATLMTGQPREHARYLSIRRVNTLEVLLGEQALIYDVASVLQGR